MKIGRLHLRLHFFKPSKTYGKYHLSDVFGYIPAHCSNAKGCIITILFFIHIFIDWRTATMLTTEILEKNGFERCATAPSFWLVGDLYYGTLLGISEDSYEDTWHVSTFTDHNDNDWVLFKVLYVEELQLILRLLDIKKNIVL